MSTQTFRDAVAAHLQAHAGEWVNAETLMDLGGRYAWRTRVSEARTQLGLTIQNRQRRMGQRTVSEYRLVEAKTYTNLLQVMEAR